MIEPDGDNDSFGTQESQPAPPLSDTAALKMRPFAFALLSLAGIFFIYQVVGGGLTLLIFGESVTEGNVEWMGYRQWSRKFFFC